MPEMICLNPEYSTTRLVSRKAPIIASHPDSKIGYSLYLPPDPERKGEGGLRLRGYFKKSLPDKPLITVITVVFNGAKCLEVAINSILNQTYDNVEYIVIDGGSTDGSVDILNKYDGQIDYWVSENDGGIYDAMNKGCKHAGGDFVNILNADDWHDSSFAQKHIQLLTTRRTDFSYGSIFLYSADNKVGSACSMSLSRIPAVVQEMPFPHVTLCVKREVFLVIGGFDVRYRIAADHDFVIRLLNHTRNGVEVPSVLSNVSLGGVSNGLKTNIEYLYIAIRHGKGMLPSLITFVSQVLKYYLVRLLPNKLVYWIQKLRHSRFSARIVG